MGAKRNMRLASFVLIILNMISCNQIDRETLLNGNFGTVDTSAPLLISPLDGTKIAQDSENELKVPLSWEAKQGVTVYELQVSLDSDFNTQILGSPFLVKSKNGNKPDPNYSLKLPESSTYYWRVRTNAMPTNEFSVFRVLHGLDAIYVYCPDAQVTPCTNDEKIGNRISPFQVISDAMGEAKLLDLEIKVAARGGTGFYSERLNLSQGITLKGGFSGNTWQRDINSNPTIISLDADKVIVGEYIVGTKPITVDGFTINNISSAPSSTTVYLEGFNTPLTLSNNIITGGSGSTSHGIEIIDVKNVTISNNTINGGTGTAIRNSIKLTDATGLIHKNTISNSSGVSQSYGIRLFTAPLTISENTITITGAGSTNIGIRLEISSAAKVIQNTITSKDVGVYTDKSAGIFYGNTVSSATSVYVTASGTERFAPVIIANALTASGGATNLGVRNNNSSDAITMNNIIRVESAGTESKAIHAGSFSVPIIANNTINITGNVLARGYFFSGNGVIAWVDNNIFSLMGSGMKNVVFRDSTAGSLPQNFRNNNFYDGDGSGSFTFYTHNTTDYSFFCSDNKPGTSGGCATGVNIGTTTTDNRSFDNTGNQLFVDINDFSGSGWSLKSTATQVIDSGLQCVGDFVARVFLWGTATDQAECDSKFPHSNSTYNAGNCQSTYLYPAIEIDHSVNGVGPFNVPVAGNGLCEAGETCLYNPNIGAYPGHGNLVSAGCDLSGVGSGQFANVTLLKYESNGY